MTLPAAERFREVAFQFLTTEIEVGHTPADLATRRYAEGGRARGLEITAKVEQACQEAHRCMQDFIARGWDVSTFANDLRALDERLAALQQQAEDHP